ncbi:hypothetical protein C8R44DRAFT_873215 [Mycena epipterygia]|nr:hypothetical protein C8R44DRAFT_873215 [Mycena epipterygia]
MGDLEDTDGLTAVGHFVYHESNADWISWMEEYMDGAGGTFSKLASMVVRHIKNALSATDIFLLTVATKFIADTTDLYGTTPQSNFGTFDGATNASTHRSGYLGIAEALKAGLLRAIVTSTVSSGEALHRQL